MLEETDKHEVIGGGDEDVGPLEETEKDDMEMAGGRGNDLEKTEKSFDLSSPAVKDTKIASDLEREENGLARRDAEEDDEEEGIDWGKGVSYQGGLKESNAAQTKATSQSDIRSNSGSDGVKQLDVAPTETRGNGDADHTTPPGLAASNPITPPVQPARLLHPTFSDQADYIPLPATSSPIMRRKFADIAPSETTGSEANASQNIFGTQLSESIGEEAEQSLRADFQPTQMRKRSSSPDDGDSEGGDEDRAPTPKRKNGIQIHFDDSPESSEARPAAALDALPSHLSQDPPPSPHSEDPAIPNKPDSLKTADTPLTAPQPPRTNGHAPTCVKGASESPSVPSISKSRMLARKPKDGGSHINVKPTTPVVRSRPLGLSRPQPAPRDKGLAQPGLEDTQPATQQARSIIGAVEPSQPPSNRNGDAELEATYSTQSGPLAVASPISRLLAAQNGLEETYSTQQAVNPSLADAPAEHNPVSSPPQIPDVRELSPPAESALSSSPPVPSKPAHRPPATIDPTHKSPSPDPIALLSRPASPVHPPGLSNVRNGNDEVDHSMDAPSLPTRPKVLVANRKYGAKGKGKVVPVTAAQADDAMNNDVEEEHGDDEAGDVHMNMAGDERDENVEAHAERASDIGMELDEKGGRNTSSSSEPVDPYDESWRVPKPSNKASTSRTKPNTKISSKVKGQRTRNRPPVVAEESEPEEADQPLQRSKGKRKRDSSASAPPSGDGDSSSSAPPDLEDHTWKETKLKIDRPLAKKSRLSVVSVVVSRTKGRGSTTSNRSTPVPGASKKVRKDKAVEGAPAVQPDHPAVRVEHDNNGGDADTSLPRGPRVLAAWDKQTGYWAGTVIGLQGRSYMVYFDDGTIKPVKIDEMRICRFRLGDIVKEDETDRRKVDFVVQADWEEGGGGLRVKAEEDIERIFPLAIVYVKTGVIKSNFKNRTVTENYLAEVPAYKSTKVAAVQQASSRPPSKVISERSRLSTNSNRQPLSDKLFLITSVHSKSSAEYRKLTEQVKALGGSVEEDWTRLFAIPKDGFGSGLRMKHGVSPFLIVDGDSGGMKPKFMAALAVGMPCLSSQYLIDIEKNDDVDWRSYLISSGYSKGLNSHCSQLVDPNWGEADWVSRSAKNPRRPFKGKSILFLDTADRDTYADVRQLIPFCMSALGASSFEWTSMLTRGSKLEDYDFIVVENRDEKFGKVQKEIREKGGYGNTAWLKQCLIVGAALPPVLMKN